MAFDIDHSRGFVMASELVGLVRAVEAANSEDESNWVEWKSALDLRSKHGRYHVARAIIGLANRDPSVAERR